MVILNQYAPSLHISSHVHFVADILDRVSPKFDGLGLEYECLGGGRIRHDNQQQAIHIYGYSMVRVSSTYVLS